MKKVRLILVATLISTFSIVGIQSSHATGATCGMDTTPDASIGTQLPSQITNGNTVLGQHTKVDSRNRIVVSGVVENNSTHQRVSFVVRYSPDKSLDQSFANVGYVYPLNNTWNGAEDLRACNLAFDNADGIYVANIFDLYDSLHMITQESVVLWRLLENGTWNPMWAHIGYTTNEFFYQPNRPNSVLTPQINIQITAMTIDATGGIFWTGIADGIDGSAGTMWVRKLEANGNTNCLVDPSSLLYCEGLFIEDQSSFYTSIRLGNGEAIFTGVGPNSSVALLKTDFEGLFHSVINSPSLALAIGVPVISDPPLPTTPRLFNYPEQTSSITEVNRKELVVDKSTDLVITGKFFAPIRNIRINGLPLKDGSWKQSQDELTFTVKPTKVGKLVIQIFNGQAPVLTVPDLTVSKAASLVPVKEKAVRTLILCKGQGRAIKHVFAVNPTCPSGFASTK